MASLFGWGKKRRPMRHRTPADDDAVVKRYGTRLLFDKARKDPELQMQIIRKAHDIVDLDPVEGFKKTIVLERMKTDKEFQRRITDAYVAGLQGGPDGGDERYPRDSFEEMMDRMDQWEQLKERMGGGDSRPPGVMDALQAAMQPGGVVQSLLMALVASNPAAAAMMAAQAQRAQQDGNGQHSPAVRPAVAAPPARPELPEAEVVGARLAEVPTENGQETGDERIANIVHAEPTEAAYMIWELLGEEFDKLDSAARPVIIGLMNQLVEQDTEQVISVLSGYLSGPEWRPVFARAGVDHAWADGVVQGLKSIWIEQRDAASNGQGG